MPIANYAVKPLFAEPYFMADISHAISDEQVAFLKNLPMVKNQENYISEDLYIFRLPELKSIADAVQEALDIYAREVMGISQRLYVTQSWTLMNPPGVGMHGHTHSNSLVSGSLYYTDLPKPVARMVFDRFNGYRQIELIPDPKRANIYNSTKNIVVPRKGHVFLFPSSLTHFVEPNLSSEPRYSLAFNSFVKGKIGSYADVSELILE